MPWEWTDDPADPCSYCIQWRPVDAADEFPEYEHGHEPYLPDGSVVPQVYRGIHPRCDENVARYIAESERTPMKKDPIEGKPKRGCTAGTPQARNGGQAVKAKYGPDFFRQIGKKGGQAIKDRGRDYLAQIGKAGGEVTKARHGSEHYADIGRKGGQNGHGSKKPGSGRRPSA